MSALSTPGGGGTTAQSKPTSGKQKYQKLDINSLYCANRNENSEPSSVKSQLSRKHGMQSLGKVPSARRPPANLPSLKTETGQDPNANSISATATTVSTPPTCTSQTITTTSTSSATAGVGSGGWVALPPPSSPHFRTEFPSLEAAAQPSHRAEHSQPQAQLRPQAEGSWTSGGGAGPRQDSAPPVAQQPPTFRTILPSFLMKGSSGRELSLGALGSLPRARSARPAPRGADVLTARPILRDDQISSLDDIAHDAGWATHDDIDYNQKLDFSDGESTAPVSKSSNNNNKNRASIENERVDSKNQEPGDEDQLWAERRQKQSNEVAQAVARAKQRKEEEQRRQLRDTGPQNKDPRDRDRNDNRDREDSKEKERLDRPDHRQDNRERDRNDKDRNENRDRERVDNRDRMDNRDRFDNRDRDRDRTDRDRNRMDNRDRESDKERMDTRERDRNDNRDRDRFERDRERERNDRDRNDRDFRERGGERDYRDREREQNPAFSKQFQANIPPRFLKQQQSRQQDDHKGWAFQNKPAPRRNEPAYTAPRHAPHNGRRSYSRDYSDREDEFRREKDGPGAGPQWRSEMQDYDRPGRELDRSNSKESYKDYDYKDKRNELERKPSEVTIDQNSRTAADKLSEVFERKSIGLIEPFAQPAPEPAPAEPLERQTSKTSLRDSAERDFGKTSWADMAQEEQSNFTVLKPTLEKVSPPKEEPATKPAEKDMEKNKISSQPAFQASLQTPNIAIQNQNKYHNNNAANNQNFPLNQQVSQSGNLSTQSKPSISENLSSKPNIQSVPKVNVPENISYPKCIETPVQQQNAAKIVPQKTEKEFTVVEPAAPKPTSAEPIGPKPSEVQSQPTADAHATDSKRPDDKRADRLPADAAKGKDGVERKSSGSGSEKKGRGYGAGGGYAVYSNRGWGAREPRGRRHRAPASESDASTDGAPERRRRAPREPRAKPPDALEPFAPRGQPSRRGRGGSFAGAPRPPAPAKRVAGYGPPNTKSPFGQASRVRDDEPPAPPDDKRAKPRAGSGGGRGRRARAPSGEDDNWETTSEHSEGGAPVRRRPPAAPHKGGGGRAPGGRGGSGRSGQAAKKEPSGEKAADIAEAMTDLKITAAKKEEEVVDDGFQEVRNKKNSKDSRGPSKDEAQNSGKTSRSHSNQGGARNGSSTRSSSDKSGQRAAPATGKPAAQYERPRQANLAPRFVKQRQKQQLGLATPFGPDTGAAPPPPAVNAWDKPIAQSLRTPPEEPPPEPVAPPAPPARESPAPTAPPTAPLPPPADKAGVLDGATPPVETIIFENTNYKTAPPAEALKQKYQPAAAKPAEEALTGELALSYNGEARRPRSLQELMAERPADDAALGLQMAFDAPQKPEDSSDMKLDFAFDSDLGQLEEKAGKALGLPRTHAHLSAASTISPLAADLNLKIASVKKVWEMPAVAEGGEELQFGFEEAGVEAGAPPNVCKVKPTQQLQSPPPPAYPGAVGLVGGYGGLSVPSPPAVLYGSGQQGGLYGAFLDQGRQQFGPFPGAPYAAQSAAPYNYQPPPDMFQSLPSQYRMQYPAPAAAGGGAAFGQSAPLANNPSTVLISSTSNSLMSATVKPSSQIGAIGSKGAGVGGVGGVNTYQQQYLGYSAPDAYSLPGLLPRPAPPASSYYSYQGPSPAPSYPLQFPQQQNSFGSQYLSSQLQVAAAVQQMQQQYRAPMQQQYGPPQQAVRPPAQQLKSPLHEHANGFAPLCDAASPTPGKNKPKPPHSPPHHKYQHVPHPHHHHQQQQQMVGGVQRCGGGARGGAPRYPAPIQRPHAPAPLYRAPAARAPRHHHPPPALYYQPHQRNGGGGGERAAEPASPALAGEEGAAPALSAAPPAPAHEVQAD